MGGVGSGWPAGWVAWALRLSSACRLTLVAGWLSGVGSVARFCMQPNPCGLLDGWRGLWVACWLGGLGSAAQFCVPLDPCGWLAGWLAGWLSGVGSVAQFCMQPNPCGLLDGWRGLCGWPAGWVAWTLRLGSSCSSTLVAGWLGSLGSAARFFVQLDPCGWLVVWRGFCGPVCMRPDPWGLLDGWRGLCGWPAGWVAWALRLSSACRLTLVAGWLVGWHGLYAQFCMHPNPCGLLDRWRGLCGWPAGWVAWTLRLGSSCTLTLVAR
ncbi:hypothetical protein NDU88_007228 [Pleurodeles waltl]|uniref:Uncharacterized protein n=1 Tax=Pleurodeles waltl TaxID=8319 RepID=A0AAV7MGC3_PLEWA|nr:hypothetical protein NDU88_007228 [Pleurodeles waltl]